ncbi:hypothetical protein K1T71_006975 [Dendrolimus kikuchii]|uniref:Uncharacterized protein n=1 Tax=Dendrolimus kikuchii TaxID=765133 RepID=A0ACC1CZD6_9NEOP|nr:hypothetical protein K1T71_006975 [Dendrolimus kikuchii]
MSKKNIASAKSTVLVYEVDRTECPFREFKDNELSQELWALGPAACRAAVLMSKTAPRTPVDQVWVDEQTQPLPRSVRQYLHGWTRAEDLARNRWEAELVVFEENNGGKMSVMDMQLSHAQVLLRSSFCRRVLSACYMLERVEGLMVEHQWESFIFNIPPDGWRAKYHIYSPGMKSGGGPQHRPVLSKNGCYLVRLFYLGSWRCVWVSDQVPVDATDSPLLPFSPLLSRAPAKPGTKQAPAMVTSNVVYLWPLLLCKALLKLAAPDMNSDEDNDCIEDEIMPEFDILHTLTGTLNLKSCISDAEDLWKLIITEIPVFTWDDDDDTVTSTVKSRSTKKPTNKETTFIRRASFGTVVIADSKNYPPYALPGITPGHEMTLLMTMARDVPLKKPLPEPDVSLWKTYRWVDWARRHGLYEAYDCPRTRFLKLNGFMKLSYAPHLLDVQSTESITHTFREEHDKTNPPPLKKGAKDPVKASNTATTTVAQQMKEELREWVQYNTLQELIKEISVCYYPSMFRFTTATSHPPIRIIKGLPNRALDIVVPKSAPLYLQIDGPDNNVLKISLNMLHPRVLFNCGIPIMDYIEHAYLVLELFEWFVDCDVPIAKAFIRTRGYDTVEVKFLPGRHFCRLWIHSRMAWHVALLSESELLLGTRDLILAAAVKECPWASKFLSTLGTAFSSWIRVNRSNPSILNVDREFYKSYQPDLHWDPQVVGYNQCLLHWMFRQAFQSLLYKKLPTTEYYLVCSVLRRYFCDPDFGFPEKPKPPKSLREIATMDPCDCMMPEPEEVEALEEQIEEVIEEKPIVEQHVMDQLLTIPTEPITSQVCELATEELQCGTLKDEREKIIKRHEAATFIQAHWRGSWARKCLRVHVVFTPDVLKLVMESAFGNLEALAALMNEFFVMFPGAKYAYSVASALSGVNNLQQYHGTTSITAQCKWIPYFQGVFYCHVSVKVHFDIQSTLQFSNVAVYNNDNGEQVPQAYNAHITFDFSPNELGYTVMGHGNLNQPLGHNSECHWQLTVLSSVDGSFHVCDNDPEFCKEIPLTPSSKFHIDEIFLPNRRNILGGMQISVTKHEAVSFRACATSSDVEMVAILRTKTDLGDVQELARCFGKGEIYWPYIRLKPTAPVSTTPHGKCSSSQANLTGAPDSPIPNSAVKGQKAKPASAGSRNRSATKLKDKSAPLEAKQYIIQVVAPSGWPLTLMQWKRVDDVRNSNESYKAETPAKKAVKDKLPPTKEKTALPYTLHQPIPGDAYVELECAFAVGGGAICRREDERDLEFAAARKAWDAYEPGRNLRGAQIRKEFRAEYLEISPPPPSESFHTIQEEIVGEEIEEEDKKGQPIIQQGPTPVTESGMLEMSVEIEEEAKYLTFPEQLKDKFVPLYFLPFCMKERDEEMTVLITPDMAEAAKKDRQLRIEAALERMRELQLYNEYFVLGRQKNRCQLVEKLYVDSQWSPDLQEALEERDDAIARETLNRTLSATKKKQEQKKKFFTILPRSTVQNNNLKIVLYTVLQFNITVERAH